MGYKWSEKRKQDRQQWSSRMRGLHERWRELLPSRLVPVSTGIWFRLNDIRWWIHWKLWAFGVWRWRARCWVRHISKGGLSK